MIFHNSKEFRWYCVRTHPRKENAVVRYLTYKIGIESFTPFLRYKKNNNGRIVTVKEPMFPGYIFTRFNILDQKSIVAYAPGVSHILKFDTTYSYLSDITILKLRKQLDENESIDALLPLNIGDETTIIDGSLRGLKVEVVSVMPAHKRVGVLLELLGTSLEIELPLDVLKRNRLGAIAV